jgi:glutaredoxin-related protein
VPQLFVKGTYVGGYDEVMRMFDNGKLKALLKKHLLIDN